MLSNLYVFGAAWSPSRMRVLSLPRRAPTRRAALSAAPRVSGVRATSAWKVALVYVSQEPVELWLDCWPSSLAAAVTHWLNGVPF